MHNNEDYLDNLLNNVTKKLSEFDEDFEQKKQAEDAYMRKKNLPPRTMRALKSVRENQFLREFEAEMGTEDDEARFLEAFEAELEQDALEYERRRELKQAMEQEGSDAGADQPEEPVQEAPAGLPADGLAAMDDPGLAGESAALDDTFFDENPEAELMPEEPEEAVTEDDPAAGFTEPVLSAEEPVELPEGMEALQGLFDEETPADETADEEQILPEDGEMSDDDILDMLGVSEDAELSDIGKMLEADEQSISLEDLSADPENLLHAAGQAENMQEPEPKKKKKGGFLAKLLDLLFGEDEDEEAEPQFIEGAGDLGNISDENMEILRAMSGEDAAEAAQGKKKKKEKKKKESKEKKKKEPKEKKEKKPKEPKPKKEKKPKEPGKREKPLPKVPVILICVMAVSLFALIYLGTNLVSHSSFVSAAERSFDAGDYVGSYGELAGMSLSGSEEETYERAKVLAGVQTELNAYYSLMDVRKFDMALDALVRALGRSDLHLAEAEEWNVTTQMDALVTEIEKQLADQFNVTPEQARELYAIEDRDEYSLALDQVLSSMGLK